MTTPSGQISLNDVNVELGLAGTTLITMNDTNVRTLAGVPSGAISMQNLQGKSNRVAISYSFGTNATDTSLNVSTIAGYSAGKSDITVTVNSGVYLYATSTSNYGLNLTGATTGDTLTLVNNGYIMGQGGKGGFAPASAPATGFPGGPALNIGIGINPTITNTSGYIGGGGGGGAGSINNGYPPSGGGGGAGGGRAGNTNPPAGGNAGGPGAAGNPGGGGGGGGGRIIPGTGGSGAVATQTGETGGGAGGGGAAYNWPTEGPPFATGGAGGGGSSAGGSGAANTSKSNAAGGGGGWGASGGSSNASGASPASGGAGGKGINLNGKTITWTGGPSSSSRVYGAVS